MSFLTASTKARECDTKITQLQTQGRFGAEDLMEIKLMSSSTQQKGAAGKISRVKLALTHHREAVACRVASSAKPSDCRASRARASAVAAPIHANSCSTSANRGEPALCHRRDLRVPAIMLQRHCHRRTSRKTVVWRPRLLVNIACGYLTEVGIRPSAMHRSSVDCCRFCPAARIRDRRVQSA